MLFDKINRTTHDREQNDFFVKFAFFVVFSSLSIMVTTIACPLIAEWTAVDASGQNGVSDTFGSTFFEELDHPL